MYPPLYSVILKDSLSDKCLLNPSTLPTLVQITIIFTLHDVNELLSDLLYFFFPKSFCTVQSEDSDYPFDHDTPNF